MSSRSSSYDLALLEERTEREIAAEEEERQRVSELEANDFRYQTAEGEENVQATSEGDPVTPAVDVIETSHVTDSSRSRTDEDVVDLLV